MTNNNMQKYIIIHYGEIYLKGKNRKFFEDKLVDNIQLALKELGSFNIRRLGGRLVFECFDNYDLELINDKLSKIFGIEFFAAAYNVSQDYKSIEKAVGSIVKEKKFKKFRITVNRVNKKFPLHSNQLAVKLGDFVRKKFKKKVDLENFDLNIHLDIVRDFAFIYCDKIECGGGLPVGSSADLLCLISGGIDSPVAANMMQKRGSKITYIHFDSYPATPKENQEKIKDLVKVLDEYNFGSKLIIIPFLEIQKEIINKVPEDYRVIFYRRMMLRICKKIAIQENISALVTGESLGQVASQTVENIRVISECIDLPVLRPLIGMNKEEITELAQKIRTYEISIQPFQDCCSLYMPKHPQTHGDLNKVLDIEDGWKYDNLLDKAVDGLIEADVSR